MTRLPEEPDQVLAMVRLLTEVGFRELCYDAGAQRLAVARRLSREGVNERVLQLLLELARATDDRGSPERLFCWWLNLPSRVEKKIAEMRAKNVWLLRANAKLEAAAKAAEQEGRLFDLRLRKRIE